MFQVGQYTDAQDGWPLGKYKILRQLNKTNPQYIDHVDPRPFVYLENIFLNRFSQVILVFVLILISIH